MQQLIASSRRQVWAGLLGSFSFALVVSVIEYIRTGGVSGLTSVVTVLVGGVVGLVVGRMVMGKPEQSPQAIQSERVPCPKSPSELLSLTHEKTQIDAGFATELYIGTWLKVQEHVVDVREIAGKVKVTLSLSKFFAIEAIFDMSWFNRVKILGFGKQVTITGKVDSVDLISIHLKECKLVDE